MRLDKFLKVSRIIKRRPVANEAADNGRILINGNRAKAASDLKIGDIIEIKFGDKISKYKVLKILENPKKEETYNMIEEIKE